MVCLRKRIAISRQRLYCVVRSAVRLSSASAGCSTIIPYQCSLVYLLYFEIIVHLSVIVSIDLWLTFDHYVGHNIMSLRSSSGV